MYFKLNVDRLDCVCLKHTEAGYPEVNIMLKHFSLFQNLILNRTERHFTTLEDF